eukprot:4414211-Amphidinium_carterae.1
MDQVGAHKDVLPSRRAALHVGHCQRKWTYLSHERVRPPALHDRRRLQPRGTPSASLVSVAEGPGAGKS